MRPIGQTSRMPIDAEVIECIPDPNGTPVLVQVDQGVSLHTGSARISWKVGEEFVVFCQQNNMPVGQQSEIVVYLAYRQIIPGGGQAGVQFRQGKLANCIACK